MGVHWSRNSADTKQDRLAVCPQHELSEQKCLPLHVWHSGSYSSETRTTSTHFILSGTRKDCPASLCRRCHICRRCLLSRRCHLKTPPSVPTTTTPLWHQHHICRRCQWYVSIQPLPGAYIKLNLGMMVYHLAFASRSCNGCFRRGLKKSEYISENTWVCLVGIMYAHIYIKKKHMYIYVDVYLRILYVYVKARG